MPRSRKPMTYASLVKRQQDALATLARLDIDPNKDFHELSNAEVLRLVEEAIAVKYYKPKDATGSRARYFYERLRRRGRHIRYSGFC